MKEEKSDETVEGTVIEALPNTTFRVRLPDEKEIIVYLSGKMRMHRIKVLVGDTVQLELDEYGDKGRIVRRS